jgi:hypothetical protein
MRFAWRLPVASFWLVCLGGASAHAQAEPPAAPSEAAAPPETLETPYQDTPVAPPPPTPSAPVISAPPPFASAPAPLSVAPPRTEASPSSLPVTARADNRPVLPLRARRKLTLTGEIGWNGLAGFGPVLTYYPDPHLGLDLGAGLSLFGWKAGVRVRYNLLESPLTPFLGVGFNATTGLGVVTFDPETDANGIPNRDPVTVDLKPSYLVQTVLGLDFIHRRGFAMVGTIGFSWLLNHDNLDILAGEFTRDEKQAIDIIFKSGVVISLAMGYAFE